VSRAENDTRVPGLAAQRLYKTAQGFSPRLGSHLNRPESIFNPAGAGCSSGRERVPARREGRARTQWCILVGGYQTCSASVTIRPRPDGDAIPPLDPNPSASRVATKTACGFLRLDSSAEIKHRVTRFLLRPFVPTIYGGQQVAFPSHLTRKNEIQSRTPFRTNFLATIG